MLPDISAGSDSAIYPQFCNKSLCNLHQVGQEVELGS